LPVDSVGDGQRAQEVLDLRGLKCPLPALFARRALRRMNPGQELAVLADDPMAPVDIPHMCHQEGFHVLQVNQRNGTSEILLATAPVSS
jgi:tRNA 2-thiouridine synthesizing protein A